MSDTYKPLRSFSWLGKPLRIRFASRRCVAPASDRVPTEELQPDTSGAMEPPSFGLGGGFVRKKRAPSLSSRDSISIRAVMLASKKERREVGSESPHLTSLLSG